MKTLILFSVFFLNVVFLSAQSNCNWNSLDSGSYYMYRDVYFADNNVGWALGWFGTILKTTNGGTDWYEQFQDPLNDYYSIFFIDNNTGWACGWFGHILKTTNGGTNWFSQYSGTEYDILDIFFADNNNGWAVICCGTTALRTTNGGSYWFQQNLVINYLGYTCVFFQDINRGWIGGTSGTILKTMNGGSNWIQLNLGFSSNVINIFFINNNIGWISAGNGVIKKTTNGGLSWFSQNSGTSIGVALHFADSLHGWGVGAYGLIIKTTDGGTSWITQNSGTTTDLYSVYFTDINNGWVVGGPFGVILKYSCLVGYSEQELSFSSGWSTLSSYLNPENTNIESLLSPISDNLVVMKNGNGELYIPEYGIDLLHNWDINDGYQVYMTNPDTLTITGSIIDPAITPINLNAGWNLISYMRSSPLAIEQALSGILQQIIVVKDNYGGLYIPGMGINLIGNMQPGQGYHVYLSEGAVLTYPGN